MATPKASTRKPAQSSGSRVANSLGIKIASDKKEQKKPAVATPPSASQLAIPRIGEPDQPHAGNPSFESLSHHSISPTNTNSMSPKPSRETTPDEVLRVQQQSTTKMSSIRERKVISQAASPRSVQGTFSEIRESKRSNKGIFGQVIDGSKRIFQKNESIPTVQQDTSAVETWLLETDPSDDPFVAAAPPPDSLMDTRPEDQVVEEQEEDKIKDNDLIQIPKPLRTSRRRRSERSTTTVGPDPPHDAEGKEQSHRTPSHRRRRRHTKSPPADEILPTTVEEGGEAQAEEAPNAVLRDREAVEADLSGHNSPKSPLQRRGARKASSRSTRRERRRVSQQKDSPEISMPEPFSIPEQKDELTPNGPESTLPLRPPGFTARRPFPSVGEHCLSTIMSIETLNPSYQHEPVPTRMSSTLSKDGFGDRQKRGQSEARDQHDPNSLPRRKSAKSGLTKHSDLMSVVSLPRRSSKSIRRNRSVRSHGSRLQTASVEDLMSELEADERRYMRELRTLVDVLIHVLLSSVL